MQLPDGKPGHYYVTARDERGRTALLLGPFTQTRPGTMAHRQALGAVKACRIATHRIFHDIDATFASFGTTRAPLDGSAFRNPAVVPVGRLGYRTIAKTREELTR
jgi:hypothetical protein